MPRLSLSATLGPGWPLPSPKREGAVTDQVTCSGHLWGTWSLAPVAEQ